MGSAIDEVMTVAENVRCRMGAVEAVMGNQLRKSLRSSAYGV